jgi:hypothetical protein
MIIACQLTPDTESHSEQQSNDLTYSLVVYRICYKSCTLICETDLHLLDFADLLSNRRRIQQTSEQVEGDRYHA